MLSSAEHAAILFAVLFVITVCIFAVYTARKSPVVQAATALVEYAPRVAAYAQEAVHPALAFEQWMRAESEKAAALAKADILVNFRTSQDIAAHRAAFAPAPTALAAPTPTLPPTPSPAPQPDPNPPSSAPSATP